MERDKGTVRWIDAVTGEDFTDRLNDPSIPPGEGIVAVARALGRLIAARQFEAERQLRTAVAAELQIEGEEGPLLSPPQTGDELMLNGVTYRYEGSTDDGEHFTRLKGENCEEALVSLSRGSATAAWMLKHLVPKQ